ncbi:MAG: pyrroline-5-carboxylate reductase [Candidatus Altimarinota bacterium]
MTISILGFGNMGSALCRAFIEQRVVKPKDIIATDTSAEKLQIAEKELQISTTTDLTQVASTDVLFLAVKPQTFPEIAEQLKEKLSKKTIVVSIMAGVSIATMKKLLNHEKIIRSMPNTPAMISEGVTGWYADKSISTAEKKTIQRLFECTGLSIEVKKESFLNDFTALSGSGPGFFYYVFEQWLKAAKKLDLPAADTSKILAKTLEGSLKLLESTQEEPEELRAKVTSKGGTTEAGLKVLEKAKLENLFAKTLKAAYNRSKQLG